MCQRCLRVEAPNTLQSPEPLNFQAQAPKPSNPDFEPWDLRAEA